MTTNKHRQSVQQEPEHCGHVFPARNYMVRCSNHVKHEINIFYPDGDQCFAESWLSQKHPYGYDVDYFTTENDARDAITKCERENPQKEGHWLTFTIYRLEDIDTRSHPHNPAPAIISVEPHPPGKEQLACDNTCPARCPGCEDTCPLWEHDEQVKREAREEVLDALLDRLWTSITIHPDSSEGKVIKTIVKSLRWQHESKGEPE